MENSGVRHLNHQSLHENNHKLVKIDLISFFVTTELNLKFTATRKMLNKEKRKTEKNTVAFLSTRVSFLIS